MLPLSVEQVVEMALSEADKKHKAGKLIPMSQDYDWNNPENFEGEEPQTVYSLINLFSEFVIPEYECQIESALYQKYHKFF